MQEMEQARFDFDEQKRAENQSEKRAGMKSSQLEAFTGGELEGSRTPIEKIEKDKKKGKGAKTPESESGSETGKKKSKGCVIF